MCMFIVWYPIEFSRVHDLHPWYWNSLIRSHLLWGEFSAFSVADAIHNSPLFIPPGTHHCWVDRGSIWKACPTPLHMALSVTRAPVTHPTTNRAQYCSTLKVLNFWKFTSYCSLKPLWSGMGEAVPARTSPTLHPPSPPTVHQLSRLAL